MQTELVNLKTLKDFVVVFNDVDFRFAVKESLEAKKKRYNRDKAILIRFKELLEFDVRDILKQGDIDIAYFPPVWEATWKFHSSAPMRRLKALADQTSKLDLTLSIADSLAGGKKFKRGRYSDLEVEQANAYPLEDLIPTKSKRSKGKTLAICPFHSEKTPSFTVFKDNSWHCFGCGKHGSGAIGFVVDLEKVEFLVAVERLLG